MTKHGQTLRDAQHCLHVARQVVLSEVLRYVLETHLNFGFRNGSDSSWPHRVFAGVQPGIQLFLPGAQSNTTLHKKIMC